jgi:hypothetical protein
VHLVEILLPVADNEGQPFDAHKYVVVREELSRRFGGITAFTRAPAEGSSLAKGTAVHDDIIVFEVMTDTLDRPWWEAYRKPRRAHPCPAGGLAFGGAEPFACALLLPDQEARMDANSGEPWSEMDISDLTNELARGRTMAQTASFLCRDQDQARQKAKE